MLNRYGTSSIKTKIDFIKQMPSFIEAKIR